MGAQYSAEARASKDVLRIHREGCAHAYKVVPYYPDMPMYAYLAQVIAPALRLTVEDESVYQCIGWRIPHLEPETVVVFERDTRLCRLGDVIAPDSDLFWMPVEKDGGLVKYTYNAAP